MDSTMAQFADLRILLALALVLLEGYIILVSLLWVAVYGPKTIRAFFTILGISNVFSIGIIGWIILYSKFYEFLLVNYQIYRFNHFFDTILFILFVATYLIIFALIVAVVKKEKNWKFILKTISFFILFSIGAAVSVSAMWQSSFAVYKSINPSPSWEDCPTC